MDNGLSGPQKAQLYVEIGWLSYLTDSVQEALDCHLRAVGLANGRNSRLLRRAFHGLSAIYAKLTRFEDSVICQQVESDIAKEMGDPVDLAWSIFERGTGYMHLGQWRESQTHFEKALSKSEELGIRALEAISSNELGRLHPKLGDLDRASDYCERSLRINQEDGRTWGIAHSYEDRGAILLAKGQSLKALHCLVTALQRFSHVHYRYRQITVYIRLAEIFLALGSFDEALHCAGEALDYAMRFNYRLQEAVARRTLARIQLNMTEPLGEAEELLSDSARLLEEIGEPYELAKTYYAMGLTDAIKSDTGMLHEHLSRAIEIFETLGAKRDLEKADTFLRESDPAKLLSP